MIDFWNEFGIETSLNGGLKSINPDSLTTFL